MVLNDGADADAAAAADDAAAAAAAAADDDDDDARAVVRVAVREDLSIPAAERARNESFRAPRCP